MPTKANAATLTVIPVGEIQKNPGDSIEFIVALTPTPFNPNVMRFLSLNYNFDGNELSFSRRNIIPMNTIVNNTTTIGRITFDVLRPIKDGRSDFNATAFYEEGAVSGSASASGADVVPEPLTIFGTATALGGIFFKRKSLKNKKS
jgi:hypothetical protein